MSDENKTEVTSRSTISSISVARMLSFALLLAIIILLGVVFYHVMAGFLIPMFLAALLVVMFQPIHKWFRNKFPGRRVLAASLTTISVLLTVLVPLALLTLLALAESRTLLRQYRSPQLVQQLTGLRDSMKLTMPSAQQFQAIDLRFESLMKQLSHDEMEQQSLGLAEIYQNAAEIAGENKLPWPPEEPQPESDAQGDTDKAWQLFYQHLMRARDIDDSAAWSSDGDKTDRRQSSEPQDERNIEDFEPSRKDSAEQERQRHVDLRDYRNAVSHADAEFATFKVRFLGGPARALFMQTVNPSETDIGTWVDSLVALARKRLPELGGATSALIGSLLLGTAIMIFSLYFFLLDGDKMIRSIKGLSPLDDQHESELIIEFGRVSRAVVLATLLSALVQGLLAGIGFWFVGLESIFLLTLLSAVLAMVPFVGAASVWIPCALYLYFVDQNLAAAIGLAIYGFAVISMADNVIKPLVLHGQSNLHPLLALLSVIGGVGSLGPIGILVGPMVVVFLQTMLKILRRELDGIDNGLVSEPEPEPVPEPEPEPAKS